MRPSARLPVIFVLAAACGLMLGRVISPARGADSPRRASPRSSGATGGEADTEATRQPKTAMAPALLPSPGRGAQPPRPVLSTPFATPPVLRDVYPRDVLIEHTYEAVTGRNHLQRIERDIVMGLLTVKDDVSVADCFVAAGEPVPHNLAVDLHVELGVGILKLHDARAAEIANPVVADCIRRHVPVVNLPVLPDEPMYPFLGWVRVTMPLGPTDPEP